MAGCYRRTNRDTSHFILNMLDEFKSDWIMYDQQFKRLSAVRPNFQRAFLAPQPMRIPEIWGLSGRMIIIDENRDAGDDPGHSFHLFRRERSMPKTLLLENVAPLLQTWPSDQQGD